MTKTNTDLSLEHLELLAYNYIDECLNNTKEHPTASGRLVKIKDRHIPTIDYFLRIWIPLNGKPKLTGQLITVS